MITTRIASPLLAFLATMTATRGVAQRPTHTDTLSVEAAAESLQVITRLKSKVYFSPNDSAAWHRLGMVAWTLADRAKTVGAPPPVDINRMGRLADSSLRIAADLSPRDVNYRLAVGQFLLTSKVAITRSAARGHFEKAVEIGRNSGMPSLHALAAMESGRTFWWRYDVMANRYMFIAQTDAPRSVSDGMNPLANGADALAELMKEQAAMDILQAQRGYGGDVGVNINALTSGEIDKLLGTSGSGTASVAQFANLPRASMKNLRQFLTENTVKLGVEVAGESDFDRAYEYFTEGYATDPSYPGAFRALAMVYADRGMWSNLEHMADQHVRAFPKDSLAWMALGLAKHRLEKDAEATAAFDSGVRLLGAHERAHLDSWERVLPLRRTAHSPAEDSLQAATYWMIATPLWADSGRQTRIEFLSRVTYAELRWTIEEFGLSGADTDRGDIFVRYGPPNKIMVLAPAAAVTSDITTFWLYDNGLIFAFRGMPTFGTAHIANNDVSLVSSIKEKIPVLWDNVGAPKTDSLPVQASRFRAGRDSVDIVLAAGLIAPDTIKKTMSVIGDVNRYFWLVTPDLARSAGNVGKVDTAGVYGWTKRLAPATLIYRVEEFAESANRAGRSTGILDASTTGFPLRGFGVSDLLIGVGQTSSDAAITRWSDVRMSSTAGTVARNSDMTVVWENYDLTEQTGSAAYDVTLTLRRQVSAGGKIVARLAGALANVANLQTDADQVEFKFSRTAPYSEVIADHVTLALHDTPSGTYTLTLELTDRTSGKTAKRVSTVVIKE